MRCGWSYCGYFFFSSRRRHTRYWRDWSSDVCSSDLAAGWAATLTHTGGQPPEWGGMPPGLSSMVVCHFDPLWRSSARSEEHTSELQSRQYLVCRLLLEKKKEQNPLIMAVHHHHVP